MPPNRDTTPSTLPHPYPVNAVRQKTAPQVYWPPPGGNFVRSDDGEGRNVGNYRFRNHKRLARWRSGDKDLLQGPQRQGDEGWKWVSIAIFPVFRAVFIIMCNYINSCGLKVQLFNDTRVRAVCQSLI